MYPTLKNTIESLVTTAIAPERKPVLTAIAAYIQERKSGGVPILLNFICTHNSRRSHLSQLWAQALGAYFQTDKLYCYSGGTEATAIFPEVVKTLQTQGFEFSQLSQGNNPIYAMDFEANSPAVIAFSKKYDHPFNPKSNFAAIMTCDAADQGCPFIAGAETRLPLTFEDPKISDGTPEQEATYATRSLQIATELKYVFELLT